MKPRSIPFPKRPFESLRGHNFLRGTVDGNSTVVDLGANRGEFSSSMRSRYGCRCYLYEANPDLAEILPQGEGLAARHGAISDEDGEISFNLGENDETSSLLTLPEDSRVGAKLVRTVTVPSINLRRLLEELPEEKIDLLKVDIEGAEVRALEALTDAQYAKIGQITVEFHCSEVFGFNLRPQVDALCARLEKLGFELFDFTRPGLLDVLLVNKAWWKASWLQWKMLKLLHDWYPCAKREARVRLALRTRLRRLTGQRA